MQLLKKANIETLAQLSLVLRQLSDAEYKQSLKVLHNSSIGQHVRHILEFYQCLFEGMQQGQVDYDSRQRDLRLEADRPYVLQLLDAMTTRLQTTNHDSPLYLKVAFGHQQPIQVQSTLARELTYLIEHSIHHMAIINIALGAHFETVVVPANFGIAYSTINYKQTLRA